MHIYYFVVYVSQEFRHITANKNSVKLQLRCQSGNVVSFEAKLRRLYLTHQLVGSNLFPMGLNMPEGGVFSCWLLV